MTCTSSGAPVPVTGTATSFTVSGLAVRAKIACVVRNRVPRATVQVIKNYVGAPSSTTIFVDQNGTAPFDASTTATASGASASFSYPLSTSVNVGDNPCPSGLYGNDRLRAGLLSRTQAVASSVTAPAVDGASAHVHDHEHIYSSAYCALDSAGGQELRRRLVADDDIRRPERRGAIRRVERQPRRAAPPPCSRIRCRPRRR